MDGNEQRALRAFESNSARPLALADDLQAVVVSVDELVRHERIVQAGRVPLTAGFELHRTGVVAAGVVCAGAVAAGAVVVAAAGAGRTAAVRC